MGELRRFIAPSVERTDDVIEIRKDYHHLAKVLRARAGEQFVVNVEGDPNDYLCVVAAVSSDCVTLNILSASVNSRESSCDVTLCFGCLKGGNTELVVQKAVELGAKRIVPFTSRYSVSSVDEAKAERLTRIAREACKQCCRTVNLTVEPSVTLKQLVQSLSYGQVLFCCEKGGMPIAKAIDFNAGSIAVIVGSEGGFAPEEIELLTKYATPVSLGKRILRAETAVIYALSVIDGIGELNE